MEHGDADPLPFVALSSPLLFAAFFTVRPLKTHGKNFVVRLIKPHDKAAFAV
jgi:hypothetical protein